MALHGEVEAPESVSGEGVGSALKDDGARLEDVHHFGDEGLEEGVVGVVVDAVVQRHVERVVLAALETDVAVVAWGVVRGCVHCQSLVGF